MRRRIVLAVFVAAAVMPGAAGAFIDTARCSDVSTSTSVVEGYVKNVLGVPVANVKVRIFGTHFSTTTTAPGTTDATGFYYICAPSHNTYVVEAQEQNPSTVYAEVARTVTTFADFERIDFTNESGYPLYYLANLSVAPVGVSSLATNAVDRTWTFRFRTKAPAGSGPVQITLDHDASTSPMTFAGNVNGWNVYTKDSTAPFLANDSNYYANARGYELTGSTPITQLGRTSYYVDGRKPEIGTTCRNASDDDFVPGTTTNPRPLISLGACDWGNAAKTVIGSGLDGYTAMGKVCPTTSDCTPITSGSPTGNQCLWSISCQTFAPTLISSRFMQWTPSQPFPLGIYYFRYSIRDRTGNLAETPTAYSFSVVETGGSTVYLGAIVPSDGAAVIGCSCTTAASIPGVTFEINDLDGQGDIALGSIKVQIRYMGEQTQALSGTPVGMLVYDYDSSAPPTALNGGTILSIDARRYKFSATGFRLQVGANRLPGRYMVTATASDNGGNSDSLGWLFYLVAAV